MSDQKYSYTTLKIGTPSTHRSIRVLTKRVRVTLLLRGKRQGGEFSVAFAFVLIASDRHLRYLPLYKGACLGIVDILGVLPSRPGDSTLQGLIL